MWKIISSKKMSDVWLETGGRLHAVEAPANPDQVPMRDEKLALGIQTWALNPHHKPGLAPCLVVLGVLLSGLQVGLESTHAASTTARAGVLSADERSTLLQYAKDTWRSFDRLILPSGLPADGLRRDSEGRTTPWMQTSPTDIAAYLWSVQAAERLHLIGASEARSRLDRTLTTLAGMDRTHGFFVNELDPRTGVAFKISPFDSSPSRLRLSAVDNAWLAVALTMVANANPSLRKRSQNLLEAMDFRYFYDPYDAADPVAHPGQLRVGYRTGDHTFYGHYGMLNTEARIVSYLGIVRGQLPPEHYYRMFRTLPEGLGSQGQLPRGETRKYNGVSVFEGSYNYRGVRIVPSWGGSMFEAMMVTLFVPEDLWAPRSWGINHPLYVRGANRTRSEGGRLWLLGFLARRQSARRIPSLWRKGLGDVWPGLFLPRDRRTCSAAPAASFKQFRSWSGHAACLFPRAAIRSSRGGRQSARPCQSVPNLRPPGIPGLGGCLGGSGCR